MQRLPHTSSMIELSNLSRLSISGIKTLVDRAVSTHGLRYPPAIVYNARSIGPVAFNKLIDAGFEPIYEYRSRHDGRKITTFAYTRPIKDYKFKPANVYGNW
jgi:hypothetical protein